MKTTVRTSVASSNTPGHAGTRSISAWVIGRHVENAMIVPLRHQSNWRTTRTSPVGERLRARLPREREWLSRMLAAAALAIAKNLARVRQRIAQVGLPTSQSFGEGGLVV